MSDEKELPTAGEKTDGSSVTSPRMRSRLKTAAINLALLSTSLLVAALLGEAMFRLVAPQQLIVMRPDVWQPADTLGWVNRPNVRTSINTGERTVQLITDENGMRVGKDTRRDGDLSILLLGDSFMQALQVEHEQSLAGLFEARLPTQLARSVSVWNAGVDGWGPNQYLAQARRLLARHEFNLIVVALYLGNDVTSRRMDVRPPRQPAQRHVLRIPHRLASGELIDAVLYPINDIFETRSHLLVFFKRRLHALLLRMGLTADEFPQVLMRSEATSSRWNLTAEICRDIATLAAEHGTPTIFALIPAPFSIDPAVFDKFVAGLGMDPATVDLDQPTRFLGAALEDHGLIAIPVLDAFRAAHGSGIELYGRIDRHLSPAGHETLAGVIEPYIVALLKVRQDLGN